MHGQVAPLVAHVIHHLVIGGMENGLVNLINQIPVSRYRHAVICIEDYSDFRDRIQRDDVDVIALHRSSIGVWGLRRELFKLFRRLSPAIVHSRNLSGLDALFPAWLARVPVRIHGEHGWDVSDLGGTNRKSVLLRKLHSPLVDQYVAVSGQIRDYLVDRVGVSADRVTRICNGVDTNRFSPGGPNRRAKYPDALRDDETFIVGTVGRLQPVKDQETLIRAFAQVCRENQDLRSRLRLALVGDGPSREALVRVAQVEGVHDITWFAGATAAVPELLAGMDLFVLPSLSEGISNTILEAMACGVPVLATEVGGNPELVAEGVTGALFGVRDVGALASLIREIATNPSKLDTYALNARARATELFSLEAMTEGYCRLYDSVLQRFERAGESRVA